MVVVLAVPVYVQHLVVGRDLVLAQSLRQRLRQGLRVDRRLRARGRIHDRDARCTEGLRGGSGRFEEDGGEDDAGREAERERREARACAGGRRGAVVGGSGRERGAAAVGRQETGPWSGDGHRWR